MIYPNRSRSAKILRNIYRRDQAKALKSRLVPRRFGSQSERYFVRMGHYTRKSYLSALKSISKHKKGFRVKIGGVKRGTIKQFKSFGGAKRAIGSHYTKQLTQRLGKRGATSAKRLFRLPF